MQDYEWYSPLVTPGAQAHVIGVTDSQKPMLKTLLKFAVLAPLLGSSGGTAQSLATSPDAVTLATDGAALAFVANSSGQCLQIGAGSTQSGATLGACTFAENQVFVLRAAGEKTFSLQPLNSTLCLEALSGSQPGTSIARSPCRRDDNQLFRIAPVANGLYEFQVKGSGLCLDSGLEGVFFATCGVSPTQHFRLQLGGPDSPRPSSTVSLISKVSGACIESRQLHNTWALLLLMACNAGDSQAFLMDPAGAGWFRLVNRSGGMCVTPTAPFNPLGTAVWTREICRSDGSQLFRFAPDDRGTFHLTNLAPGYCLDVKAGMVVQNECSQADTQRFRVQDSVQMVSPSISAVVNAASFVGGALAPGELVVVFGSNLGPEDLVSTRAVGGAFPKELAGSTVMFDEFPAPLVYLSSGQVSAVVPFGVTGRSNVQIKVEYKSRVSNVYSVGLRDAAPAIFTSSGSGAGPAAALNQDGSLNSAGNPGTCQEF